MKASAIALSVWTEAVGGPRGISMDHDHHYVTSVMAPGRRHDLHDRELKNAKLNYECVFSRTALVFCRLAGGGTGS
jgi:hypothetical protein